MKRITIVLLGLALLGGAGACTGSKSLSRKAAKLEEAGLDKEASGLYFQSLQRNQNNVKARIGLKKTGQKLIDSKLNEFYKAHSVEAYKDAVYSYIDAMDYKKKCAPFVELTVLAYYEDYYKESLDKYLDKRYTKGEELVYEEKYEEADKVFKEIVKLNPEYKDAKEMASLTTVEPLYRKGVEAFESGKYRSSYSFMQKVLKVKPSYKDAIDYKDESLEKGTMTIAVLPFGDQSSVKSNLPGNIQAGIVQSLVKTDDPFLKVIDRKNTDVLLKEQKLSVNGVVSESSTINAGELLGAKVLITGKVLNYEKRGGTVKKQKKQGYTSFKTKKINPKTKETYYVTNYKKTYYNEYEGNVEVYCSFEYQMISAETGEILTSDVINVSKRDAVNYATYNGEKKNLYAGTFKSAFGSMVDGDKVYTSYRDKKQLDSKLNTSKRTLKSKEQLGAEASKDISRKVYSQIQKYNPEK